MKSLYWLVICACLLGDWNLVFVAQLYLKRVLLGVWVRLILFVLFYSIFISFITLLLISNISNQIQIKCLPLKYSYLYFIAFFIRLKLKDLKNAWLKNDWKSKQYSIFLGLNVFNCYLTCFKFSNKIFFFFLSFEIFIFLSLQINDILNNIVNNLIIERIGINDLILFS